MACRETLTERDGWPRPGPGLPALGGLTLIFP
jgi:hypothetical protein